MGGFGASFTILITSYSPEVANVLAKHVRKMGPVTIAGLYHPGHWWILSAPFLIVVLCEFFVCLDVFCNRNCLFYTDFERVVLAPWWFPSLLLVYSNYLWDEVPYLIRT